MDFNRFNPPPTVPTHILPMESWKIARRGEIRGLFSRHEISHSLRRGNLPAASHLLRDFLNGLLKCHPGEHTMLSKIGHGVLRFHSHDNAAIGEGRIPPREAHAIHNDFVVFRRGWHNESPRAHAERMHSAAIDLSGQVVASSG